MGHPTLKYIDNKTLKELLIHLKSIGPSGVDGLPLAAGINVGGHYFPFFLVGGTVIQNPRRGRCRVFKFPN